MDTKQPRITVTIEVDGLTVTSHRELTSGNPAFLAQEAHDKGDWALTDVVAALAAVKGDVRR